MSANHSPSASGEKPTSYYVPASSPWPMLGSFILFITVIGAGNFIQGHDVTHLVAVGKWSGMLQYLLPVGLLSVFVLMWRWFGDTKRGERSGQRGGVARLGAMARQAGGDRGDAGVDLDDHGSLRRHRIEWPDRHAPIEPVEQAHARQARFADLLGADEVEAGGGMGVGARFHHPHSCSSGPWNQAQSISTTCCGEAQ